MYICCLPCCLLLVDELFSIAAATSLVTELSSGAQANAPRPIRDQKDKELNRQPHGHELSRPPLNNEDVQLPQRPLDPEDDEFPPRPQGPLPGQICARPTSTKRTKSCKINKKHKTNSPPRPRGPQPVQISASPRVLPARVVPFPNLTR